MKTMIISLILIGLLATQSYAREADHMFTDDYRNGYSLDSEKWFSTHNQYGYIKGILDTLRTNNVLVSLQRLATVEALRALRNYYTAHPKEKTRPILKVIMQEYPE